MLSVIMELWGGGRNQMNNYTIDKRYLLSVKFYMDKLKIPYAKLRRPRKKLEIITIETDYCKEWYG